MESPADRALAERLAGPGSESIEVRGIRLRVVRAAPEPGPTPEPAKDLRLRGRLPAYTPPRPPPPLLLLHGFGASAFSFRRVLPLLAEDRTVVAYDRPGFGLSERPRRGGWHADAWPRGTPYSPEAQADIAVALLDRLGIEKAVPVGHSAGGAIAALAAVRHCDRIPAVVLVDAAMTGPPGWALSLAGLPVVRPVFRAGARLTVDRMGRFLSQAWYDPSTMPPETIAGFVTPAELPGWEDALVETMAAGPLPHIVPALAALDPPALVLWGEHDRVVPLEQGRTLAKHLSRATLEVLPCCGHLPPEEHPERFARAVRRFLNSLSTALG